MVNSTRFIRKRSWSDSG